MSDICSWCYRNWCDAEFCARHCSSDCRGGVRRCDKV